MTPVALLPPPPPARTAPAAPLRQHAATLVLGLGLLVSLIAFRSVREREKERLTADFERRVQTFVGLATDRLQRHQDSLYTLRNLFHFFGDVTREEFSGAAHDLISRQIGVQALEWIARVPGAERAAVEAAVRAEGFPDFQFTERVTGSTLRVADLASLPPAELDRRLRRSYDLVVAKLPKKIQATLG